MNAPEDAATPTSERVLGSFLSAVAGWLALTLTQYAHSLFQPPDESYWWPLYPIFCIPFIVVVWLVALLPLYLQVPAHSLLWRWPVCTAGGATAGTLIALGVWCVLDPSSVTERFMDFLGASGWLGGVCGGATCFFGSLTAQVFRRRIGEAPALDRAMKGAMRMSDRLKAKFFEDAGQ